MPTSTRIATAAAQTLVREFLSLPAASLPRVYGNTYDAGGNLAGPEYDVNWDDLRDIAADRLPASLSSNITLAANAPGWEQGRRLHLADNRRHGPFIDLAE